jgi:ubiquinol-cytochrome c reductase cytochrome b subunit
VSSGSQPDFYIGFLDGSTRLFPSWEIRLFHHTIPPLFWPTLVLPGILFTLAGAYPFLEAKLTGDRARHNLLQRPRDVPVRTGLGAMAISFYAVLLLSGGNDLIAKAFDISLNAMTWGGRIALLVVPPLSYAIAYQICIGLQRHDREVLEHGIETGIIKLLPNGEFIEIHQPLGPVDDHGHGQLQYAGSPVPKKMNKLGNPHGNRLRGFFYPVRERADIEAELQALAAEQAEHDRRELTD